MRDAALATDALHYHYLAGEPDAIRFGHTILARYLRADGRGRRQAWAHHLAAAIIDFQTGSGGLVDCLDNLAGLLGKDPGSAPDTFNEVVDLVERIEGVRLADLVQGLPRRARTPQAAMDHVLHLAGQRAPERTKRLIVAWDRVLSALHASLHHPDPGTRRAATAALDRALAANGQLADWRDLVAVLRRLQTGEHDAATNDPSPLLEGLDDIDTAITRRAIDLLTGTDTGINPDAWRTPTGADHESDPKTGEQQEGFIAAVAAAATGDPTARALIEPVLDEMAAGPDTAPLAAAIRNLVSGTPVAPTGLRPDHVAFLDAIHELLSTSRQDDQENP